MADAVADDGAFAEAVVFPRYFNELPDHRQSGEGICPLDEVLLLCLPAVPAGAEAFTDIARFGERKLELLRRFRSFGDGTPSDDQLGDIFATLDAEAFQRRVAARVAAPTGAPAEGIAVAGETVCRSCRKAGGKAPIPMVSAFAARRRLVLGQVKVAEKSNEISAIPKLLEMMAIEGAIVGIDAMGCQRDVARKIIDKKADYVLALKGNQGRLRQDVRVFVEEQKANGFENTTISRNETVDGDHGRIETRATTVIHDVEWLKVRHDWPGLQSIVIVDSTRDIAGEIEQETRLYITSSNLPAEQMGPIVRSHWAVESAPQAHTRRRLAMS